ncbi:hemagglutinin repeat-containing protein [Yersinia enterocolitica]|uniref:hemagglutinin repeat-containing protein n=1 Tax=Yersinia enterocolitica TaxID=630 RepID=UPI0005E82D45|nr:hemagglutinin repeat-containing protein [Yersinia enterocolitica]EKN4831858.1 hemagglutinin repeat-containing protein [Yersinia enterocolitica]EKN4853742.1 hemagglutinin repeat-containing protein [Yersinia enterocolitica]ELW8178339.1 hemagglutinin repeat-containing protein [Yersinia enterocolitica]CQH62615.1 Hemolysin [Yersinia enterocolitica]
MKQNKFRLSPAGKLAAAVAIISVSVATCYAAGIVGAGDPAHNPGVSSINGAAVVDIVKPSASGLSHNQYNEFNVSKEGAVFNNSLSAGQSQLAGQLSANQNLNGQAANIILNEVISRNPSLLLGKQEVFGMAADYILANPNGITCDGCGFINTTRNSLVVGNPLVDQGNLQGFDTRNNTNLLNMTGYTSTVGPIDLIAPRINMLGAVDSRESINVILGQNKVGTDGEILASQKYVGSAYDSKIFGGMMAGRIRIINTAEGNGVNMSSGYTGRESIDISTPGTLNLDVDSDPELNYNPTPASLSGKNITINAGDIFASGDIIETSANGSTTQTLERTKIKGSNISIIAKKKNHLDAAIIDGKNIVMHGGNIQLNAEKLTNTHTDGYVQAAEGGIKIDNAVSITTTKIDERTGVAFNITGSSHKANNSDEKITGSELVSDANLKIIAKDNVDIIGSLVKSAGELGIETLGDINVKAAQTQQQIDEQKTKLTISGFTSDDGKHQYQAGLKLTHTSESEKTDSTKNHAASLEGSNVKLDAKKDVTFTGSNITATKGDAEIKGENVSFVAAQDTLSSDKSKETVGVDFHYTGGMDKAGSGANVSYEDTQTTTDKSAAVVSNSTVAGNLNIIATKDVTNQGTNHSVGGAYQVEGNNIHNLAAENNEITNTKTTKVDVGYEANIAYGEVTRPIEDVINNGKKLDLGGMIEAVGEIGAPNAGVDFSAKGGTKETHLNSSQSVVTSIKGGNIALNAAGEVKDQGTKYQADKGGITLDAASHTSEAAINSSDRHITETSGEVDMRIYTSTGKDITLDGKGKGGSTDQHVKGDIAQVGSMNAANGININVKQDAVYQGTNINAGDGKTTITAGNNIRFEQATNHTSESHNNVEANAKANLGTNTGSKNFGAGLGGGNSKGESSTSVAQVSQLQGQQGIELNAGKDLTMTGTTFGSKDKATGDVQLIAGGKVDVLAAQSHGSKEDMTWSAKANAGISQSSGTDKNNKGISAGAEVKVANKDESALKHQGSVINSNGTVTVKAGGHDNQAIHMQNANITSQKTTLTADNGGILLESAQDKEHKNNWKFTVGANGNQNSSFNKDDKGVVDKQSSGKLHNISAELDVNVEQLDAVIQQNTHINSNNIVLNSAKDAALSGGILKASNMTGVIGGDLKVQSREDSRHEVNVNTGFGFNHSNEKQDSLITQAAEMSPIGSDKVKKTLTTKSNKLFDKVKKQYDQISSKFTTKEEDNVKTLSYTKEGKKMTLDESTSEEETKEKWWQKGAKAVGKKVKTNVQDEQVKGGNGKAKIEVEVVDNKAVAEQSAISGTQSVNLNVAGKTELIGGKISSQDSDVNLQTNGLELQDINGKHTQGGARVNASTKITETIGSGVGEMMEGKTPVLGAHGGSEQKNAVAGVTRG